jgi:hypothetical protein
MKTRWLLLSIILILLSRSIGSCETSADEAEDRQFRQALKHAESRKLKGLGPIGIVIERLSPDIEKKGLLTTNQLETNVELRLRKTGINVIPRATFVNLLLSENGEIKPYLHLEVETLEVKELNGLHCISIILELVDSVTIERGRQSDVLPIWSRKSFLYAGENRLRTVLDIVGDLVDEFCNQYLMANPRK